ncbi:hypothetical protein ECC02_010344 [Trypanosoma cruzi]|uniref:Uncharacterized protein n=1 Tax=Trypanosoma cruzi TaxID=5693 RepID=A0A7J6XQQ1_TRYCR|nr:hypothetical protein ECC02_010344 [Trypanosoma cruzi]
MSLSSSSGAHGAGTAAGETDVRSRWCPLLDLLSVDTDAADGASVSLMIVAHVTYRSALLTRALRLWRHRRKVVVERRHWQACLAVEWHARRRSFLFFRAWQWRYREVQQHKANTETAEGHCVKVALRRAMEAWRTWSHAASELRAHVTAMGLRTMKSLLLRCWNAWHHHAQRCIVCNKLTTAAAIWRQQSCWVVWRHVTWKRRGRRLHVAALLLHVPVAWMEGDTPVAATSSCAPPTCSTHTSCLCGKLAWGLLAMRFYWIWWLGGTARRRAIRLHRHETALEQIESHRDRRAMAHGYQRWLMRTASTLHSRRSALVIFVRISIGGFSSLSGRRCVSVGGVTRPAVVNPTSCSTGGSAHCGDSCVSTALLGQRASTMPHYEVACSASLFKGGFNACSHGVGIGRWSRQHQSAAGIFCGISPSIAL